MNEMTFNNWLVSYVNAGSRQKLQKVALEKMIEMGNFQDWKQIHDDEYYRYGQFKNLKKIAQEKVVELASFGNWVNIYARYKTGKDYGSAYDYQLGPIAIKKMVELANNFSRWFCIYMDTCDDEAYKEYQSIALEKMIEMGKLEDWQDILEWCLSRSYIPAYTNLKKTSLDQIEKLA